MIFPAGRAGIVRRETNVTYVPVRDLRPAWRLLMAGSLRSMNVRAGRQFLGRPQTEGDRGRQAVFEPPVLMIDPAVLGLVEPHQPERLVGRHALEQVQDLDGLAGLGTGGGLRQQHRPAREGPYLFDGLAEDADEGVARPLVVTVDADPVHVLRP